MGDSLTERLQGAAIKWRLRADELDAERVELEASMENSPFARLPDGLRQIEGEVSRLNEEAVWLRARADWGDRGIFLDYASPYGPFTGDDAELAAQASREGRVKYADTFQGSSPAPLDLG